MTTKTEDDQSVLARGARMAIMESARDLERVVRNLNRAFRKVNPPLRLDSLPGYQTALDAIKDYSEIVVDELNRRYKEGK